MAHTCARKISRAGIPLYGSGAAVAVCVKKLCLRPYFTGRTQPMPSAPGPVWQAMLSGRGAL